MNVELSPEALADIQATLELIASRDEAAAEKIAEHLWAVLEHLAEGRLEGPKHRVRWRGRRTVVRSWPVHPFRLFYRRTPESLNVLRALHYARRPIAR